MAEVGDGALHLEFERTCQVVFAQTVARLPSADVFPDGAALVFDYKARGEPAEGQPLPISVSIGSRSTGLLPSAEPKQHRFCVQLERRPLLVELTFAAAPYGFCDEDASVALFVSNLRLEADEDCW